MEKGPTRGLQVPKVEGNWEQKESKIFESIDKKLEVARKLKRVIENIKSEKLDKAKAEIAITQLQKQITQQMSPEMKAGRQRILEMEKVAKALGDEIERFEEEQFGGDWDALAKFYEGEGMEKINKVNELTNSIKESREENSEMEFFMTALDLLDHVKLALSKIEEYRANPDLALKDLARARGLNYEELKEKLKISEIVFTPISANLVLEKGATFEPLYKDYDKEEHEHLGLHSMNSFVNIISGDQSAESIQETIKHEEEHVLGEAIERHLGKVPPVFTFKLTTDLLYKDKHQELIIESVTSGQYTASKILDSSHDEILTALAESPKLIKYLKSTQEMSPEEILVQKIFGRKELPKKRKISEKDSGTLFYLLSTAGGQMKSILDSLKKGEGSENERFREVCKKLRQQYINAISSSGQSLGYAYSLADKLGKKAQTDVMLLTYLLKPSQYHHIPEFIKRKYRGK